MAVVAMLLFRGVCVLVTSVFCTLVFLSMLVWHFSPTGFLSVIDAVCLDRLKKDS